MTDRSMIRLAGFSLVEVLVAVVILSIGMLGLAKLQFWGVRHTGSAYFRTQATQTANEMVERMRANPIGVAAGRYSINGGDCAPVACDVTWPNCRDSACTPEQLAEFDIREVACGPSGENDGAGLDDLMPEAGMRIRCETAAAAGNKLCLVEVCWKESDAPDGSEYNNVILEVVP